MNNNSQSFELGQLALKKTKLKGNCGGQGKWEHIFKASWNKGGQNKPRGITKGGSEPRIFKKYIHKIYYAWL